MFTSILCPIDFSARSRRALAQAIAMARVDGAAITGAHVLAAVRVGRDAAGGGEVAVTREADVEAARVRILELLRELGAPFAEAVVARGNPAVEIEKLARSLPADLIVMSVHGTEAGPHECGAVTQQVVCHASVPVLVVSGADLVSSASTPRRIVCGIDFSPASLKALRFAGDLAADGGVPLSIVHVMREEAAAPASGGADTSGTNGFRAMWNRRLRATVQDEIRPGIGFSTQLRQGDPASELLQAAADEGADLVVIGGHRGNPPGCVMNAVVTRARCPVLTVRGSR